MNGKNQCLLTESSSESFISSPSLSEIATKCKRDCLTSLGSLSLYGRNAKQHCNIIIFPLLTSHSVFTT